MKEYTVKITETLEKTVHIQANSETEAEKIAKENWDKQEYILDADDFINVEFKAENKKHDYDFEEYCPYCDDINEVVWDGISHTTVCENCHQPILLCSICEAENCGNCPYEKELGL